MNELQVFTYNDAPVRTVEHQGEQWWVLKDVCDVLKLSDTGKTAERLDTDELTRIKFGSGGQTREMLAVNESGLYNVILRSDKPQAKSFRKWVTSEVLPAIRKHGMYATDELIENPDIAIAAFTALKEERAKRRQLETKVAVQEQQISELKPKVCYYDVVLNCSDLMSTTEIAKDYGKSAKWLNAELHELKVQFKQGDVWILYQKYAEKGYTSTKTHNFLDDNGGTHCKVHTYWTQKGRLFIYELLKSRGILPTIEKETNVKESA